MNSINLNGKRIIVGQSKNADFSSILEALNSSGIKTSKGENFTIVLESGMYNETPMTFPKNVTISGTSPYWGIEKRRDFDFN